MGWLTGWSRRLRITVQSAKVPGALTNFPILITEDNFPAVYWANVAGDEVRFTLADGETVLSHEVAAIDTGGETQQLWVKHPSIGAAANTHLYIYYDNSGASAPSAASQQATWSNGFAGVYHMGEASGDILDSTGNGYDLTNSGAEYGTTGKIGDALTFVAANDDYIERDCTMVADYPATLEAWINTSLVAHQAVLFVGDKDATNKWLALRAFATTGLAYAQAVNGVANSPAISTTNVSDGEWHHIVGVYSAADAREIFVDGESEDTDAVSVAFPPVDRTSVGRFGDSSPAGNRFNGPIDEVRVSSVERSAKWLEACFNNQDSPATFYAVSELAVERRTVALIANAEPAAGAHETSAEHEPPWDGEIHGMWLYTDISSDGWAADPRGGFPRLIVSVYPRQASAGDNYANEPIYQREHPVNVDGAYHFADYIPGPIERFFVVDVHNLTDQAMATNSLNVYAEYIIEG